MVTSKIPYHRLRAVVACLLSFAILLSVFHGSACQADVRQDFAVLDLAISESAVSDSAISDSAISDSPAATVVAQSPADPQHPVAQHPMADHCLIHLIGDIAHPDSIATIQHIKTRPNSSDDATRPIAALESPFKPPRA